MSCSDTVEIVLEDADGEEATYLVEYDYSPGCKGVRTLRNGDPGYPDEEPEVDITSIRKYAEDMSLGEDLTDSLSEANMDKCVEAAYQNEAEKEDGEYDDYEDDED